MKLGIPYPLYISLTPEIVCFCFRGFPLLKNTAWNMAFLFSKKTNTSTVETNHQLLEIYPKIASRRYIKVGCTFLRKKIVRGFHAGTTQLRVRHHCTRQSCVLHDTDTHCKHGKLHDETYTPQPSQ